MGSSDSQIRSMKAVLNLSGLDAGESRGTRPAVFHVGSTIKEEEKERVRPVAAGRCDSVSRRSPLPTFTRLYPSRLSFFLLASPPSNNRDTTTMEETATTTATAQQGQRSLLTPPLTNPALCLSYSRFNVPQAPEPGCRFSRNSSSIEHTYIFIYIEFY